MTKLIAILNVIAWGGFWAFGYLALTADPGKPGQMVTALVLAFAGAVAGFFAYLWLVRHTEATGYAKPSARVEKHDEE